MEEELKSRKTGVIKHRENPFVKDLVVPVKNQFTNMESGMFVSDDGEGHSIAQITRVKAVDSDRFIKLFTDELRHFFDLKPTTQRLLQVLLSVLQERKDKDIVYLDYNIAEDYFSKDKETKVMSRPSFHRAMKELIDKDFIAESMFAHQYFINPKLFFNGDRLRLVKEYVKKTHNTNEKQCDLFDKDGDNE